MIPFSQKLLFEYFFRYEKQNQNLSSYRNNIYNNES